MATASSTTTHRVSGTSISIGDLRAFLDRVGPNWTDSYIVSISVNQADRPNDVTSFTLSVTIPPDTQ